MTRARQLANRMFNPFRRQKGGKAWAEHEWASSSRIGSWKSQTFESHELAVGNPTQLGSIRNSPKGRKGGGSTHNTRWSERRLKIAITIYTIGYKYTQLRIDGNTYYRYFPVMQSCNIQQCHTHHNHAIYNIPLPVGGGFQCS